MCKTFGFLQGFGGRTTTCESARKVFGNKELRERPLILLQDDVARGQMAKIMENCAVMLRVIDSSELVDTDKLEELQKETIALVLEFFPATEFSQYIHEFLWHSAQCISEFTKFTLLAAKTQVNKS